MAGERGKRFDWKDFFMGMAVLTSKRSSDPNTKVGACVVDNRNIIVGVGYNEMPKGSDTLKWDKDSKNSLENKYPYVCHAALNAILKRNTSSVEGCALYTTLFPCNECAKAIVQSGIKEVIYLSDHYPTNPGIIKLAETIFNRAGVKCSPFKPKMNSIVIDYKYDCRQ
ncbi:deoxycytidylate deaminase-like [Halictus rubicundus]|uniref:deoxycytidylate deaminase-like n=1 Tax=Halictus rubicundus TaxID=77578 RepID=UPI004035A83F